MNVPPSCAGRVRLKRVVACAKKHARKELRAVTDVTPRATFQRSTGRIANIQQAPTEFRRSRAVLPFGAQLESGRAA